MSSRTGFVAPAPPPLSTIKPSASPVPPVTTSAQFISPRAPPLVTVATNVTNNQRDSTLIELLKKGSSKVNIFLTYMKVTNILRKKEFY